MDVVNDSLTSCPAELLEKICGYLPAKDVKSLSLTNTTLCSSANSSLWHSPKFRSRLPPHRMNELTKSSKGSIRSLATSDLLMTSTDDFRVLAEQLERIPDLTDFSVNGTDAVISFEQLSLISKFVTLLNTHSLQMDASLLVELKLPKLKHVILNGLDGHNLTNLDDLQFFRALVCLPITELHTSMLPRNYDRLLPPSWRDCIQQMITSNTKIVLNLQERYLEPADIRQFKGLPVHIVQLPNLFNPHGLHFVDDQASIFSAILELDSDPITIIDAAYKNYKFRIDKLPMIHQLPNIQVNASSLQVQSKSEAEAMFKALAEMPNLHKLVVDIDRIPLSVHRILRLYLPSHKIRECQSREFDDKFFKLY